MLAATLDDAQFARALEPPAGHLGAPRRHPGFPRQGRNPGPCLAVFLPREVGERQGNQQLGFLRLSVVGIGPHLGHEFDAHAATSRGMKGWSRGVMSGMTKARAHRRLDGARKFVRRAALPCVSRVSACRPDLGGQ